MNRIVPIIGGLLLALMIAVVDAVRRRPAPGRRRLRVRPDQGSDHRARPELQAAAAVPERAASSTTASRRSSARRRADLHRREEEPGDRLARQVAHQRPRQFIRNNGDDSRNLADRLSPIVQAALQRGSHQAHRARSALERARQGHGGDPRQPRRRTPSRSASRSSTCASSASTSSSRSPNSVYSRMKSERKQVANQLRSTGAAEAEKIRADADRQREVIVAEAYRDAQKIKGDGDAKASAIYADAFGKDPQFAQFYRSLEAYRASFNNKGDVMVVDPSTDFFKYFRVPAAPAPRPRPGSRLARGAGWDTGISAWLRLLPRGCRAGARRTRQLRRPASSQRSMRANFCLAARIFAQNIRFGRSAWRRARAPRCSLFQLPRSQFPHAELAFARAYRRCPAVRSAPDRRAAPPTARYCSVLYGYELVMPPLLEYLESLLSGTGHALDLQHLQAGRPADRPHAGPARRHHAAGRAHRRPPAESRRA